MDARQYLSVELQRLDLLLHREVLRLRAAYQLSLDEFRGLYISDEQVNQLIDRALNYDGTTSASEELTQRAAALRAAANGSDDSPWHKLVREFSLAPTEQDILLLAVAPEIDLKYETLFAYLNNDITRRWPTFDLALRVCSMTPEQRVETRRYLLPGGTLFSNGLLRPVASTTEGRSWLATGFTGAPMLSQYLSGISCLDPRLAPFVEERVGDLELERLPISREEQRVLRRLTDLFVTTSSVGPILVLSGRDETGRSQAAEAVCHELGLSLLRVDLEALRACGESIDQLARMILLHGRLKGAGLYLTRTEALFDKESKLLPDSRRLIKALSAATGPIFIACMPGMNLSDLFSGQRAIFFHFADPDYATRLQVWERALAPLNANVAKHDLEALADRFALSASQISSAVASAVDAAAFNDAEPSPLAVAPLFEAARAQSDQSLGNLAVKVKTVHTWPDVILPAATLQRVKEITAAIKHRHLVYGDWGFERRIAYGKGLKALFAGASGTGKTMTAGVIARELELDLYKIDLSAVVSKYIGETEKNLDRIFRAADSSNAILFFDEADALFGKRSETKDAHDRYANIEVAYLLQKVEDYEGVVILASNLSKNIDEAFSRRMHYVVSFPLPDESDRERLWRGMFPPEVPLDKDIDFQFLAQQFSLAGGDIRNVALEAAFLAAQDGKVITMKQLVKAMARQMMKQGKIASPTDFKQYHALITEGS